MIVFVNHYEVEDSDGHFVSFHQTKEQAIDKAVVLMNHYEPREGYVSTYCYDGETVTTVDLTIDVNYQATEDHLVFLMREL